MRRFITTELEKNLTDEGKVTYQPRIQGLISANRHAP